MTKYPVPHRNDLWTLVQKEFEPFFKIAVGHDDLFHDLVSFRNGMTTFPPHNIRRKGEEYFIDLAIAGFDKEDLEITLENDTLTISGKSKGPTEEEGVEFLHRGIAERAFSKSWSIGRHTEILEAKVENGTLTVHLKNVTPEEDKLRTIEIK